MIEMNPNVRRIMDRIDRLSECSQTTNGVTRFPFTKESTLAETFVMGWMEEAGMKVRKDAVNNIIGRFEGSSQEAPVLLIGSHLDTVREGGKYDGMLGVIAGIEVIQLLKDSGYEPVHPIEVIGFCDEEGARFHTTLLGSRAVAGTLSETDLLYKDENGISIAEAMSNCGLNPKKYRAAARRREELLGYLELHIEQGPVLEENNKPCGVVSGIAGASRLAFTLEGKAGHAGTVPMNNRKDALVGAALLVAKVEEIAASFSPLVATVGKLSVSPGVSNVIPGKVTGSLDIRDMDNERKEHAISEMENAVRDICSRRNLSYHIETIMETPPVHCSVKLTERIAAGLIKNGIKPIQMMSGAGHDAMAMAKITDIGMIFVRCKDGVSHHPDEYVSPHDLQAGVQVMLDTVIGLIENQNMNKWVKLNDQNNGRNGKAETSSIYR